jgi:hypothetical protein
VAGPGEKGLHSRLVSGGNGVSTQHGGALILSTGRAWAWDLHYLRTFQPRWLYLLLVHKA